MLKSPITDIKVTVERLATTLCTIHKYFLSMLLLSTALGTGTPWKRQDLCCPGAYILPYK